MSYLSIVKGHAPSAGEFAEQYCRVREKEGRMYSDKDVAALPQISPAHRHADEWKTRKISALRLVHYLEKLNRPLSILEVGCGNGWLSAMMAGLRRTEVTGIDINNIELEQAERVFAFLPNLSFFAGDLRQDLLPEDQFDVVVFAASIQYFPSFMEIIGAAMDHLSLMGEIHIIDSRFYRPAAVAAARSGRVDYYTSLGFPGMAAHYYHHQVQDLELFQHQLLYDPHAFIHRFYNRHPFPWVRIKHRYR